MSTAAVGFGRWTYDRGTDVWCWSDEVLEMFDAGLTNPVDLEAIFERMRPEDRESNAEQLADAVAGSTRPFSGRYRFRTDTRGERAFVFVGEPTLDDAGHPVGLRGYTIDVSDDLIAAANEAVRDAMQNRAAIEQVKGALMMTYGISDIVAFETLRRYSMLHNVKLAKLSEDVIARMGTAAEADAAAQREPGRFSLLSLLDASVAEHGRGGAEERRAQGRPA